MACGESTRGEAALQGQIALLLICRQPHQSFLSTFERENSHPPLSSTNRREYIGGGSLNIFKRGTNDMAEEAKETKEPKKPAELLLMAVLGLLTIAALLLILTDLQGWI